MSKWSDDFIARYKDTNTVERLKKEIEDAFNKEKLQKETDVNISRVCRGEVKRLNKVR